VIALVLAALLPLLAPPGDEAADLARAAREARRAGHAQEALALFDERDAALLADPRVAGERIQALLDAGRADEAAAASDALGEVREGPVPLAIARMRLATARGQPESALAWANSVRSALGDNPDLAAACVEALLALQRWHDADAAIAQLPATAPPALRARLTVDRSLARARTLDDDPDLVERAIPMLEQALSLAPDRDDVKVELVEALALWHRPERADELAQDVLARAQGKQRAAMLYALGQVRRAELRDEEAEACFREVLALQPDHPRAQAAIVRCCLRQGREAEGLALLDARLAAEPHDAEAQLLRAENALEQRDAAVAVDALHAVLEQHPQHLKALYMLSRALALQGQQEEQAKVLASWRARKDVLAKE
jgi:tetratricopeptide (TPR) repeat protein